MQNGPALCPGSLISESTRILDLVFQDPFYVVYSAEATASGAKVGITEFFPDDLVARAPSGEVLLRSLELQDLFNLGRDRFMAEVRALSALRHPSLLRFDGILSDHGTAFALHAAAEGQSVTSLIKSSKQPPLQDELDTSVKRLVSALELLHSRDLIHANITPDTILLRPEPLLIRFGAARSFLAARMRKVNLAVTPGYSAPELHFSDAEAHGPLCDIFSLAAVLYYLVTCRHPINVIARGLGQTMPPAAAVPFQKFRPEFLAAIDRGLELDPERRPQTIKAFGQMLLGITEEKGPENRHPALQMAANLAEGQQNHAPPSAAAPNGPPSPVNNPPPKHSASGPNGETHDDDDDDDLDEHRDFGSSWGGLGIGRLLVLAVLLALLIPTGLSILGSQFRKEPEQPVYLKSAGSGSAAPQEQPVLTKERLATAMPSERGGLPAAAEPDPQTAPVPEPSSAIRKTEAEPPSEAAIEKPKPQPQEPKAEASAEAASTRRSPESPAREPARPSTDRPRTAALHKPEAIRPERDAPQIAPAEVLAKRPPDVSPAEPAAPPAERSLGVAIETAQAKQPDAPGAAPAQQPEKAPIRVAKADAVAPPLPEASATSPAGFKFKDCDFCPPLVVVPGGAFQMGSSEHPHEKPAHKVRIALPFAIGQYELTYAEWDRCVEAGACRYRPEHQGSPNDAIGNLSWDDANAYLKWMSEQTGQIYRLPSEAEWEYAARAGIDKRFWWGDQAGSGKANCSDCGAGTKGQPSAAGSFQPNPFGLYDTAGNMAEWVQDCWNKSYQGAPADGSAWVKGNCGLRGLRGGSFGNKSTYIRSSARFRYDSDVRYEANGFRVLRELR